MDIYIFTLQAYFFINVELQRDTAEAALMKKPGVKINLS